LVAGAASPVWPILAAVAVTVVVAVLIASAVSLSRTAAELRSLADELNDHASAILGEVEATVEQARRELERVDDLVGSAEVLTETVGSAGRLAQAAVSTPLIKLMAFGAGTARAGRRLRGKPERPRGRGGRLRRVG
jgi:malonyl CoA-acyl carrier protein transacylase